MKTKEDYNKYMREYMHQRRKKRRAALFQKLEAKCKKCDSTKNLRFAKQGGNLPLDKIWAAKQSVLEEESQHCVLLCPEHYCNPQPFRHGGYHAYYRRKCRCEDCEEWYYDWLLRRKEDRRKINNDTSAD